MLLQAESRLTAAPSQVPPRKVPLTTIIAKFDQGDTWNVRFCIVSDRVESPVSTLIHVGEKTTIEELVASLHDALKQTDSLPSSDVESSDIALFRRLEVGNKVKWDHLDEEQATLGKVGFVEGDVVGVSFQEDGASRPFRQ